MFETNFNDDKLKMLVTDPKITNITKKSPIKIINYDSTTNIFNWSAS